MDSGEAQGQWFAAVQIDHLAHSATENISARQEVCHRPNTLNMVGVLEVGSGKLNNRL